LIYLCFLIPILCLVLAEVPPEVKIGKFYVKETIIQEDQFVPHFSLIYNFPML
jgi:hypothetical protein